MQHVLKLLYSFDCSDPQHAFLAQTPRKGGRVQTERSVRTEAQDLLHGIRDRNLRNTALHCRHRLTAMPAENKFAGDLFCDEYLSGSRRSEDCKIL